MTEILNLRYITEAPDVLIRKGFESVLKNILGADFQKFKALKIDKSSYSVSVSREIIEPDIRSPRTDKRSLYLDVQVNTSMGNDDSEMQDILGILSLRIEQALLSEKCASFVKEQWVRAREWGIDDRNNSKGSGYVAHVYEVTYFTSYTKTPDDRARVKELMVTDPLFKTAIKLGSRNE
jgi:hypothetical protein